MKKAFSFSLLALGIVIVAGLMVFLPVNASGKAEGNHAVAPAESEYGRLEVRFDYIHYPTLATGQYAIWIENEEGQLVRTVFVTAFTGHGGYINRPDCCPTWVSKANPQSHSNYQIDAYTGPTPSNGPRLYVWDGCDDDGVAMPAGNYRVCIEGTLYWSSRVLFQGMFELGGSSAIVDFEVEFSSNEQTNRDMITNVTAEYIDIYDGVMEFSDDQNESGVKGIYDLQGRRVSNPKSGGVYIIDGKKQIIIYNN